MIRPSILDRLQSGEFLVLDGATGTELENRGIPADSPVGSASANLNAPNTVKAVHAEYLAAGADIITSFTFSTGPSAFARAGKEEQWKSHATAGIEIAIQTRNELKPEAFVAAGFYPGNDTASQFEQRVQLADERNIDLVLAEVVTTIETAVMVAEAFKITDLPVFIGIGNISENGNLRDGSTIDELLTALKPYRVDGIMAMDSFPPSISAALPKIMAGFDGPVGVYPHVGLANTDPRLVGGSDIARSRHYPVNEFAECAAEWKNMGAKIIGGCCGTTPAYIKTLQTI